jgi:UDPglucose 6-dehydrogenase
LSELLLETQKSGKLSFTADYQVAVKAAEIVMIIVGTPSGSDGNADLQYVFAAAESLAPHLKEGAVVVIKSTVPPGTNAKVKDTIKAKTTVNFDLASVPEFLSEGSAVENTLHPDRVVLGVESDRAREILTKLHSPLSTNIIVMLPESAQMCKYAANNYLATRITFINQIADLCEHNGADIEEVIRGIGEDKRIGSHYWYPGLGYGGSCFPKDVKEISAYAKTIGENESLFIAIDDLNDKRISRLMERYDKLVDGFSGKTIAILGLSFKPNTNDTREAPAGKVISWLKEHGAKVITVDPKVPADTTDPYQAAIGTHAIMLLVEWDEYLKLDLAKLASTMQTPKYFFDTRNRYNPAEVESAGLQYKGIGR